MSSDRPFLDFQAHSRAFLARAREELEAFRSTSDLRHFFYSALELRLGIEARVTEYLRAAVGSLGRDPKDVNDYVASKLLRRLAQIDDRYERAGALHAVSEQTGQASSFQFTPVTRELAGIHGRLGELLHFKFFLNNEHWIVRKPLGGQPHKSAADFVPLLERGIEELGRATTGTLLGHPRFTEIVRDVLGDGEKGE